MKHGIDVLSGSSEMSGIRVIGFRNFVEEFWIHVFLGVSAKTKGLRMGKLIWRMTG